MPSFHFSLKSGKKGQAANHSAYITRTGRHGHDKKDLVIAWHGNLPGFANGKPGKFWSVADTFERQNGAVYREYEMALPGELNRLEQLEIVDKFIQTEIGTKPYQLAIHEPIASIGGVKQPHVHIMVSDRKPDGIDRSAEQHFRRYNPNKPESGGCKKEYGAKSRTELKENLMATRESWANIQNAALEKSGHEARVDSRSHKARGITSAPEKHIGQLGIKKMSIEDKATFHNGRLNMKQHSKVLQTYSKSV